jgi:hypothetical protein
MSPDDERPTTTALPRSQDDGNARATTGMTQLMRPHIPSRPVRSSKLSQDITPEIAPADNQDPRAKEVPDLGALTETSPTKSRAPSIPDRPKPSIPARPSRSPKPDDSRAISPEQAPAPKAKPAVPARPANSKFANLKSGFMDTLASLKSPNSKSRSRKHLWLTLANLAPRVLRAVSPPLHLLAPQRHLPRSRSHSPSPRRSLSGISMPQMSCMFPVLIPRRLTLRTRAWLRPRSRWQPIPPLTSQKPRLPQKSRLVNLNLPLKPIPSPLNPHPNPSSSATRPRWANSAPKAMNPPSPSPRLYSKRPRRSTALWKPPSAAPNPCLKAPRRLGRNCKLPMQSRLLRST